jgi:hypothetical protein
LIRDVFSGLLFVGNALDARDLRSLYDTGIKAVVDLAINETPAQLGRDLIYCRFPINDGDGNSDAMIQIAIQTVCSLVRDRIATLVACSAGMSRAPSIASVSIAIITNQLPDDCLRTVIQNSPNDVSPILWDHVNRVYNTSFRP